MRVFSRRVVACAVAAGASLHQSALADPVVTPAFAATYTLQPVLQSSSLFRVDQLAFNPADPNHIYAARVVFDGEGPANVMRFDYAVVGGVPVMSNPLTVATLEPGWGPVGVAFWNGQMVLSYSHHVSGSDAVGAYNTEGRLAILPPNPDGTFGSRVDFAYGMFNSYHQIDQMRISGNALYVGIGTRDNGGAPASNAVYNGTVGYIADLGKVNFTDGDNDDLADVNALAADYATAADDGKLRMYAKGFRNPFGVMVTADGKVWISDNGRDALGPDTATPDVVYKDLALGSFGTFPPGNGGTTLPLADLGDHTAATGLAMLPGGPDVGDVIAGRFRFEAGEGGQDFVIIDAVTGTVTPLARGFGAPIDAIVDPYGNVLLADFNAGSGNGAVYLLAVPEPASVGLMAAGALGLLRRRR